MSINIDKMKQRKSALQNNGGSRDTFWRPVDGEQTIRIVPTADGDPFKDYWFHYNVGNNPGFLSPKKNFGEEDPLNDFVRKLFNEGTEDSIKMAKNLMARQRFFSPVLVRGEEDKGVRIWGYGKMVYEQLLNLVLNPEYGDITDTESGTDLVLTFLAKTAPERRLGLQPLLLLLTQFPLLTLLSTTSWERNSAPTGRHRVIRCLTPLFLESK